MTVEKSSFARLVDIINHQYAAGHKSDKYLILDEPENANRPGTLKEVELFLRNVEEVVAFKFDQVIAANSQLTECYAALLADMPGNRSMCDFIVFYRIKNEDRIHVWAVNLKSTNTGNNVRQLRAAKRVIDFLLGKLVDLIEAEMNKPVSDVIGQIDFILFSSATPPTNPKLSRIASIPAGISDNSGRTPVNFHHSSKSALRLAPLAQP